MQLDDLDRRILQSLSASGRAPYSVIARELGSSEATIRKRVERLIREGVVSITAVSNPYLLGFNTLVMIAVKVDLRKFDAVAEELSRMEELSFVACASGEYDIVVVAAFESDIDLYRFLTQNLANVDGVISSHTTHLLRLMRRTFSYRIPQTGTMDAAGDGVSRPQLTPDQGWDHPALNVAQSGSLSTRHE